APALPGTRNEPGDFWAETQPNASEQLAHELRLAEKQAAGLLAAVEKVKGGLDSGVAGRLEARAQRLLDVTRDGAARAAKTPQEIRAVLDPPEVLPPPQGLQPDPA